MGMTFLIILRLEWGTPIFERTPRGWGDGIPPLIHCFKLYHTANKMTNEQANRPE
jgi:hypothetical protein